MEYRTLGASGVKVSPICLGTMMFGKRTELAEAGRIVDSARDAGINFIDTAGTYAGGDSERMVGELIRPDRDRWVLGTKVGNPVGTDPNQRGLSRRWIMRAIHDSLRRLETDYIDIYYCHVDDETTPLEETLVALGDLVRAGDIRYFGLSNFRAWRVAEVVHLCRELGLPRPMACQPAYNTMTRQAEAELLPACAHLGLGVVSYSPLARGVLSGKYEPGVEPPSDSRAGQRDYRLLETEWRPESLVLARQIKAYAERKGMSAGQFAVNWVLNNTLVTAVVAGPRTLGQWEEYLGALDHRLDGEDEAFVDGLVPPGHASTHGYTDPRYPVRGRYPRST
jgi:aryl-alcohol dehydrogenase-like predicted oxidoreductase